MDITAKREYLLKMYPGQKWLEKVSRMSDKQVAAIYYRMIQNGQKPVKDNPKERQATIYDYDEDGCFIVRK